MMEKQKLHRVAHRFLNPRRVAPYYHSVPDRSRTRGHELRGTFGLDQTHPAAAFNSDVGVVAIPGDSNADLVSDLDDGLARINRVDLTVKRELRHNYSY